LHEIPQELFLLGTGERALEEKVEGELQEIKAILPEAAVLGRSLQITHHLTRRRLFDQILPSPGLIDIGDNFYTGWFYINENGRTFITFRGREIEEVASHYYPKLSPYFLLKKEEANMWNSRLKDGPLTTEEVDRLRKFQHEDSHPLYQSLFNLILEDYVKSMLNLQQNLLMIFGP